MSRNHLLRILFVLVLIISLLLGVAAEEYGFDGFGAGSFGIGVDLPSSGGGGSSRSCVGGQCGSGGGGVIQTLVAGAGPISTAPIDESPALVRSPAGYGLDEWHASVLERMERVRDDLAQDGLNTDRADGLIAHARITIGSPDPHGDERLVTLLEDLESHAAAALYSRAAIAHADSRQQRESDATDSLVARVIADSENRDGAVRTTLLARDAFARGEYEAAAFLIADADREMQDHVTQLDGTRLLGGETVAIFLVTLAIGTGLAFFTRYLLMRSGLDAPRPRIDPGVTRDFAIAIIVGTVVLAAAFSAFAVAWGETIVLGEHERMDARADGLAQRIDISLREIQIAANGIGIVSEGEARRRDLLTNPDSLPDALPAIRQMVTAMDDSAPNVIGAYAYFNPELFGNVTYIWYGEDDNGTFAPIEDTEIDDPLYLTSADPRSADPDYVWWFLPAIERREVWTPVYVDTDVNLTMISYAGPILVDGELMGVYGVDLSFDEIARLVREQDALASGVVFLLDEDGEMVVPSSNDLPWLDDVRALLLTQDGLFENGGWVVAHRHLSTGHHLVMAAPLEEMEGIVGLLRRHFVLLMVVFGIILIGCGRVAMMASLRLRGMDTTPALGFLDTLRSRIRRPKQ